MAGAGFIRRYGYFPGVEELTAIEGVVIVDQRSPGPIRGVSYGVVAIVGETADMRYCCTVNSSGVVQSKIQPQEVYGGSDLIDKIGPFSSKIGQWGGEMGNLFAEVRNKAFSRLVVCPVDRVRPISTDQYAIRVWRQLPTNRSATDTLPIVPVIAARVSAGTLFIDGSANKVYLAQPVDFTGKAPMSSGVDGTTVVTGFPAATTTIERASGSWITDEAAEGDLIVPGSLTVATGTQNGDCALAGTLRIVSVDSATVVTVERLDGSNFVSATNWRAGTALAWRLHHASDGDSSGVSGASHQLSEVGGYTVLAVPGTATIAAATALTPSPAPTAPSSTYWDVFAGLSGVTHPSGALTYDANVHAANMAANAGLRTRYQSAFDALLNDDYPTNVISFVVSARKDASIQAMKRAHCLTASSRGLTRDYCISPKLDTVAKSTVLGSAAPGVGGVGGAIRSERGFYSWPGVRTFIPELVGTAVSCPDGTTTDDGVIDVTTDTWLACLMSNLQPELNPGQAADPVPRILAPVMGYQRGCPSLDPSDYILFKQYGICAIRMDRVVGPVFQSGVTTSQIAGETNINRRRMADFVQDSLAARYNQMAKMLGRASVKDALLAETDAFYADLLSENNPEAQRIHSYVIDDRSGNSPSLSGQGVWVIRSSAKMLMTLDTIVAQVEVSPTAITVTVT